MALVTVVLYSVSCFVHSEHLGRFHAAAIIFHVDDQMHSDFVGKGLYCFHTRVIQHMCCACASLLYTVSRLSMMSTRFLVLEYDDNVAFW